MNIRAIKVKNDSMGPILNKDDVVFVGDVNEISGTGIYHVQYSDDSTALVRAQLRIDGDIYVYSDATTNYYVMTERDFNSHVRGKVLWICRQEDYYHCHTDCCEKIGAALMSLTVEGND